MTSARCAKLSSPSREPTVHGRLEKLWQDELREPGDLAPAAPVTDRELELAEVLIRELTGVEGHELHDEYAHALEQLVAAKADQRELVQPPETPAPVDLMAALEASVRAAHAKP
ncbi:hypothetical protein [Streptomyces sp. NPDC004296]|uniref:hypothetical protein n=1 Tax=Streptomyces sp. NPDC004296 TaxID=3364697 RepID=UPI003688DFA4